MSNDYKRGYAKGYIAGSRKSWPLHRPPLPPDNVATKIIETAQALRDEADQFCATVAVKLAARIDAFGEAMTRLGEWLKK